MTAMARAFEKTGIHARDIEIDIAISKLLNSGCTIAEIRARLNVAEKLLGQGHTSSVSRETGYVFSSSEQANSGQAGRAMPSNEGHLDIASPGTSLEGDGGQSEVARKGQMSRASFPSSNRDGGGHKNNASESQLTFAPSVCEPSAAQRAASLSVAKISIMDTLKIDGRPFRTWGLAEAERAGRTKTRDGYILQASVKYARQRYANLKGDEKLGDLIGEKQLQRFHQKAAEVSDAA